MNYDAHIQRHLARLSREQSQEADDEAKRLVALELSCRQAETIVRSTILPELERLQSSLRQHGLDCTIKIGKQKFDGIPTEFEAEVTAAKAPAKLIFAARPGRHHFEVTIRRTKEDTTPPADHHYDQITPQFVEDQCAAFIAYAFPA